MRICTPPCGMRRTTTRPTGRCLCAASTCSKQNAYAEMIAVQRRFGLRGKVVGYHGIQSFREGEVTPEQAFEIGKGNRPTNVGR